MFLLNKLEEIERELQNLLQTEVRTWQRTAQLLIQVRDGELYKGHAASFTQWVRLKAQQFKIHESNFWRILKAGEFYLSIIDSEDLEQIDQAKATPEQLELVRKITRFAPQEVKVELVERAIEGSLVSADLRRTWQTYRPVSEGQTARGRKGEERPLILLHSESQEDQEPTDGIRQWETPTSSAVSSSNQLSPSQQEKLTAANFIEAMRKEQNKNWFEWVELPPITFQEAGHYYSDVFTEVAVRPGMSQSARRVDAIILLKIDTLPFPLVVGIEIKVSLSDIREDKKLTEYLPFCDYFFVGVPDDKLMLKEAEDILIPEVGILTVDSQLKLSLVKEAKKLKPAKVGKTFGSILNQVIRWYNLPPSEE